MYRNRNSANFFLYVCNNEKIKELLPSILIEIPASVRCVSSMTVVSNAKFARLLAAHADTRDREKRKSLTKSAAFC